MLEGRLVVKVGRSRRCVGGAAKVKQTDGDRLAKSSDLPWQLEKVAAGVSCCRGLASQWAGGLLQTILGY